MDYHNLEGRKPVIENAWARSQPVYNPTVCQETQKSSKVSLAKIPQTINLAMFIRPSFGKLHFSETAACNCFSQIYLGTSYSQNEKNATLYKIEVRKVKGLLLISSPLVLRSLAKCIRMSQSVLNVYSFLITVVDRRVLTTISELAKCIWRNVSRTRGQFSLRHWHKTTGAFVPNLIPSQNKVTPSRHVVAICTQYYSPCADVCHTWLQISQRALV